MQHANLVAKQLKIAHLVATKIEEETGLKVMIEDSVVHGFLLNAYAKGYYIGRISVSRDGNKITVGGARFGAFQLATLNELVNMLSLNYAHEETDVLAS